MGASWTSFGSIDLHHSSILTDVDTCVARRNANSAPICGQMTVELCRVESLTFLIEFSADYCPSCLPRLSQPLYRRYQHALGGRVPILSRWMSLFGAVQGFHVGIKVYRVITLLWSTY